MSVEDHENEHGLRDPGEHEIAKNNGHFGTQLPPDSPPPKPPPTHSYESSSKVKLGNWRENTKLGLEILGVLILIAYTCFSGLQWLQIRWTNQLTREALNGNDKSLRLTLNKMQRQIDEMERLADNAGNQANASLAANKLTEESVRGKISIYAKLLNPIREGEELSVSVLYKNVGNSPVFLRSKADNKEWRSLPTGDMPITLPPKRTGETLQPNGDGGIYFYPKILTIEDVNLIDSGNRKPFFFGKIAYETLGKEYHVEFCFYIMKFKAAHKGTPGGEVDPTHMLMECDKWHARD